MLIFRGIILLGDIIRSLNLKLRHLPGHFELLMTISQQIKKKSGCIGRDKEPDYHKKCNVNYLMWVERNSGNFLEISGAIIFHNDGKWANETIKATKRPDY